MDDKNQCTPDGIRGLLHTLRGMLIESAAFRRAQLSSQSDPSTTKTIVFEPTSVVGYTRTIEKHQKQDS